MQKPKKQTNGCLWVMLFTFQVFIGIPILTRLFGIDYITALVVVFIGAAITTSLLAGRISRKGLIGNLVLVFLLIGFLKLIGQLLEESIVITEEASFKIEEGVQREHLVEGNDTIPIYKSNRVWKDNYGNNYSSSLAVRESDFIRLRDKVSDFRPAPGGNFWGKLYDYIDRNDTPALDLVIQSFDEIHRSKQLNQMEFAEMIVSCVQDIPYSFVFQGECLEPSSYEDSIRNILENCPQCCIGNVAYGIQNPISFLQNLKGDCDTRTVLIYSLLKHYNYDVAILNSDFYRHSIIGINLPAQGVSKLYYGKKYIVWETTGKYFTPGQLPSNFSDINHWEVILTSK